MILLASVFVPCVTVTLMLLDASGIRRVRCGQTTVNTARPMPEPVVPVPEGREPEPPPQPERLPVRRLQADRSARRRAVSVVLLIVLLLPHSRCSQRRPR